jgi:nitrite reductase (NADH) large subunit
MEIVIIGNGLAGTMAAKALREVDREAEVDIYAAERHLYYPRPNLIEWIAGTLPYDKLFAFPESWYGNERIRLHLGAPATRIVPQRKIVEIHGKRPAPYDALLLANGATAVVPPIKGTDKKGVFTLRTLDDALTILEYLKDHARVAVIGGGLLGLETARALKARGAEVEILEIFDYLLPRQLDPQAGAILKAELEKRGIRIRLGHATDEIFGPGEVRGIRIKGGEDIPTEMAIIAAGVRPNLKIAQEAGLETDRGIVVSDAMETSREGIYAAGDSVEHNGRVYGIIPASFDQARVAARNILGDRRTYKGTVPSNTLKVAGLYVTSVGHVNPEPGTHEEIRKVNPDQGVYKKIVLADGTLVGAIWMGTTTGVSHISRAVSQRTNIEKWKRSLFEEDFDFSLL